MPKYKPLFFSFLLFQFYFVRNTFKLITIGILLFLIVDGCSAEFEEEKIQALSQYKLTAKASEGGSVYPEEGFYNKGATLTIVATPFDGYEFVRWEGSDNDDKPNPCGKGRQLSEFSRNCRATITMVSNREILAFFQAKSD